MPSKAPIRELHSSHRRLFQRHRPIRDMRQTAHSTTSAARARIADGMVIPMERAVRRLVISVIRIGSSKGRSATLAPFRMRSTAAQSSPPTKLSSTRAGLNRQRVLRLHHWRLSLLSAAARRLALTLPTEREHTEQPSR
jgi:hypothetical protein